MIFVISDALAVPSVPLCRAAVHDGDVISRPGKAKTSGDAPAEEKRNGQSQLTVRNEKSNLPRGVDGRWEIPTARRKVHRGEEMQKG